jgi:hypothetical protein
LQRSEAAPEAWPAAEASPASVAWTLPLECDQ